VDRKGNEEPIEAPPRAYGTPHISPDGTELVFGIDGDIWLWNLARQAPLRRLTFSPGYDGMPLWTPDGLRIIFTSDRGGVVNVYSQAADGTGLVDRLTTTANPQYPTSISPDGTLVAGFHSAPRATSTPASHVLLFPLKSTASPSGPIPSPSASSSPIEPSASTLFEGSWPEFSPDGRYVAYTQPDATGREEVFVRPFPQVDGGRWQISVGGGTRPAWARNGRELFYLDASNRLTAVPVNTSGSTFSMGTPAKVFNAVYAAPFPPRSYDVSPDGQRFLMLKEKAADDPNAAPASMVVVEHWFEELKQRVNGR